MFEKVYERCVVVSVKMTLESGKGRFCRWKRNFHRSVEGMGTSGYGEWVTIL
jgi:hypothetical protein